MSHCILVSTSHFRGKDLCAYLIPLDSTLPQRGGYKDFSPDGSWLQQKRIESFHKERKAALSEEKCIKMYVDPNTWNHYMELHGWSRSFRRYTRAFEFYVDSLKKVFLTENTLFFLLFHLQRKLINWHVVSKHQSCWSIERKGRKNIFIVMKNFYN